MEPIAGRLDIRNDQRRRAPVGATLSYGIDNMSYPRLHGNAGPQSARNDS